MTSVVAGVDGCHAGWFVVLRDNATDRQWWRVAYDFATVLDVVHDAAAIAVDIPIGLLDEAVPGGRACDQEARRFLRGARASSVFTPPVRGALCRLTYRDALEANRASSPHSLGISRQCFAITPKIQEVDEAMTPELQQRVYEIHPELCFFALNDRRSLDQPKRKPEGQAIRAALLKQHGFSPAINAALKSLPEGVAPDDILDACAACWTAGRIAAGTATRIPSAPQLDSRGLRMEMWM